MALAVRTARLWKGVSHSAAAIWKLKLQRNHPVRFWIIFPIVYLFDPTPMVLGSIWPVTSIKVSPSAAIPDIAESILSNGA